VLVTPQIPVFLPFDASIEYDLVFSVPSYSDQVIKNEIQIFTQDNNTTPVADITATSFQLLCPIPANTLINGATYNLQIRTYNILNAVSNWSDLTSFMVLSPISVILEIPSIVLSQSLNVTANYFQAQNEPISSSKFILYDSIKNQIAISPEIFGSYINWTFDLLDNDTNYFVRCESISQHGLLKTTDFISFMTQFLAPRVNNLLALTNTPQEGAVLASCKVVRILGHSVGNSPYVDNEWIDLTESGSSVYFDDLNGWSMDSGFTLKIWLKGIQEDKVFLTLYGYNSLDKIEVQYYNNRIHAFKKACGLVSHYSSSIITILPTDTVFVFLRQTYQGIDVQCEIK